MSVTFENLKKMRTRQARNRQARREQRIEGMGSLSLIRCTSCNKYKHWNKFKAVYKNLAMCQTCNDEKFGPDGTGI